MASAQPSGDSLGSFEVRFWPPSLKMGAFCLGVACTGVNSEHPENGFFFVAAVATRVDADGRQFAALAPAFDGEGGDSEDLGDFGDGEEVGEVVKI